MSDDTKSDEKQSKEAEPKPLGDGSGVYIPGGSDGDEPPIDFGSFVLSLGTSAYVSLGKVEHPDLRDEAGDPDLAAAKQVIDILKLLQEKTSGNLEPEEEKICGEVSEEHEWAHQLGR